MRGYEMKMNTKIFTLSLIALFFAIVPISSISSADYSEKEFRHVKNEAFGFGEELVYEVGYGKLIAGHGYVKIAKKPIKIHNRDCYNISFAVKSTKLISKVYYIHNRYQSAIDCDGLFSWRFKQKVHEQKYKKTRWAKFDQYKNTAVTNDTAVSILPFEQDVISAFMYVRALDLKSQPNGSVIKLHNFWKDSTFNLNVKVVKRETIKVPAGTFKCVVVEPTIAGGGLFSNDEKILVWLTDDDRKVPVKVGTKLLFGYVGAELVTYKGLRGKIDAKVKK